MVKTNFYREIEQNNYRTLGLFLIFFIFIMGLGWLLGWYMQDMYFGFSVTLIFGVIYALIAYFLGSNIILTLSGAKEATKPEFTAYINMVEGLAIAAGIPTPKAYVIRDSALNAFATGISPKNAAVTVTTGLLERLNREELEGVIAHEIAHIQNRDIRTMLIASVLVGIVTILSDLFFRMTLFGGGNRSGEGRGNSQIVIIILALILAILAPIIAHIIKLSISRKREFVADAHGAKLSRNPKALASALRKLKTNTEVKSASNATAHLYISSPLKKKSFWGNLFSTHPPIDERIAKLEAM